VRTRQLVARLDDDARRWMERVLVHVEPAEVEPPQRHAATELDE
jgi:hypothetical protein